jgi:lytic murein transglycosylase
MTIRLARALAVLVSIAGTTITISAAEQAFAASCQNSGSFGAWFEAFKKDAAAAGISARALEAAAPYLTFDQHTVDLDHRQGVFNQGFLEFSDRMANNYRLTHGRALIKENKALFDRIEQQFGVQAPVIVAFWALESDFGSNSGKMPILRSLATLAYDCRRPDMFRKELIDALHIVERGDLAPSEMIGSWAGELGGTQFVPSHYWQYGIDFDGDGKVDLVHSTPDMLATTANFLKGLGWTAGQPWLDNVRVPESLPWEKADLSVQLPRSEWAKLGIVLGTGAPLPGDDLKASLLLPMGRDGPAFLAYPNFQVYLQWNQSLVYSTTAAYLATLINGAPRLYRGNGAVTPLPMQDVKELQRLLTQSGYAVGEIDGKLGSGTRAAVRAMQVKLGLPADSYPDEALLERMRAHSGGG